MFPWLAARSRSQNPNYSFQSDVERRQLSTSSRNGDVFVGAGGTLYRLSSELQQLQNVSVPGSVVALTTTADGDYLVACFTNRRCAVYNTSTLSNIALQFANVEGSAGSGSGSAGSADDMNAEHASTFENETLINTSIFPNNIALLTSQIAGQLTLFIAFTEKIEENRYRDHFLQRGLIASSIRNNSLQASRHEIVGGFVYNTTAYFTGLNSADLLVSELFAYLLPADRHDGPQPALSFTRVGEALRFGAMITGVSEVDGIVVVSIDGKVYSYNLASVLSRLVPPSNQLVTLINGGVTISLAINVENNLFLFVAIEKNTSLSMEKVRKAIYYG